MAATPPLFQLWSQWLDLSVGAPIVISRRLDLFHRSPFEPQTIIESQRMVWEKAMAFSEMWWSLWRVGWPAGSFLPVLKPRRGSIHLANRSLKPITRRVRANVRRLTK
ncbi:MAG TPA: hypothetical protein VN680_12175 [Burkholderiaceae bacterium]|jgi:hypothetical protein|nr:hypothetical protein [Burkholderiaceae bacterium]